MTTTPHGADGSVQKRPKKDEGGCAKYCATSFKLLKDHLFAAEHDVNECDPYVKITMVTKEDKKVSRQTEPVIGGGRNVKFGEGDGRVLDFPLDNVEQFQSIGFKISVYDEDFGKDDKIGGMDISIMDLKKKAEETMRKKDESSGGGSTPALPDEGPFETTVKITDPNGMFAGNVHLKVLLVDGPTCRIELIECHGLKTQRVNDQHKDASLSALLQVVLRFVLYILLVGAMFYYVEPDTFSEYGDSCWFTLVSMSTVGYGDYYPNTPAGRYLNCFVIVLGTYVFGGIFSSVLQFFMARRELSETREINAASRMKSTAAMRGGNLIIGAAAHHHGRRDIRGMAKEEPLTKIYAMMAGFFGLLFVAIFFFRYYEPWAEEGDDGFEDWDVTIHFLLVTVSTVGYGDIAPGSLLGRIFGALLIVLGVALLAQIMSLWVEHFEVVKQKKLRKVVMEQSLTSMDEFEFFDRDGESDGVIEKHEFLGKMLILIDACDELLVQDIMDRFAELDVDNSGHLDKNDFITRGDVASFGNVEDDPTPTTS